jgi:hypothetical protein
MQPYFSSGKLCFGFWSECAFKNRRPFPIRGCGVAFAADAVSFFGAVLRVDVIADARHTAWITISDNYGLKILYEVLHKNKLGVNLWISRD